jgi:hypothetical protein
MFASFNVWPPSGLAKRAARLNMVDHIAVESDFAALHLGSRLHSQLPHLSIQI